MRLACAAGQCGSVCPGDFRARRKFNEKGDDSRLFFRKSFNRNDFSLVPFSLLFTTGTGLDETLSKLGHGEREFCLLYIVMDMSSLT